MTAWTVLMVVAVTWPHITKVDSRPPKPCNVTVVSFNMGAVLKWDIPEYPSSNVTSTAQIRGLDDFHTVCNHTAERRCDVAPLPSCLGAYELRVRAEVGAETSDWVEVSHTPLKDTTLGPPGVELKLTEEAVEVVITDPVLRVSSPLTKCYRRVSYVVKFWRVDHPDQGAQEKSVSSKRHSLRRTHAGTPYCVQARVHIPSYRLKGVFSQPRCERSGGASTSWVLPLVLLALALPLTLLTALLVYKGNRLFNPKTKLPPLFRKHLLEINTAPLNLQATAVTQEQFDQISLLHQDHSYCKVVFIEREQGENTGDKVVFTEREQGENTGDKVVFTEREQGENTGLAEDSNAQYSNVLTLTNPFYRNI